VIGQFIASDFWLYDLWLIVESLSKARIRLKIEIVIELEFNQSEEKKPVSSLVKPVSD